MKPKKNTFHSPRSGDTLLTVCKAKPQLTADSHIPASSDKQQDVCKAKPQLTDDSYMPSTPQQAVHNPKSLTSPNCPSPPELPHPETPLEDWLDPQQVLQLLHISHRTLQTLRTNGTLPYSRIGNKLYYKKQDIQKILNNNYTMYQLQLKTTNN